MKASYLWLKDYIDLPETPGEAARALTMSGSEVGMITEKNGDHVMELEITSNRPDCLNIIGLARELSAVLDRDLLLPGFPRTDSSAPRGASSAECVIESPTLCPMYTARVIRNTRVGKISASAEKRLSALEKRPVNNAVDITNFCLMELGQPMHVFDLDKIEGGRIIVREAQEGEKIVTLDGCERTLRKGMLVIADAKRPIAVAGIMGGKDTEVTEATKNILLESAYFDPISIRRTARALALSTDSSYRFERGVDKSMVVPASARAAELIVKETGGEPAGYYSAGELNAEQKRIEFDFHKARAILGADIGEDKIKRIFSRLGMENAGEHGGKVTFSIPSFREDINSEIDLVEEAARVYGYDKIGETVIRPVQQTVRKEKSREAAERITGFLASAGLNEIMTYSLISSAAARNLAGMAMTDEPVSLRNPLSAEQGVLTPQLADGMLNAMARNINRENKDLALFETGKIYCRAREGAGFREIPVLCAAITGVYRKNWQEGKIAADIFRLKGIVEALCAYLKVDIVFNPAVIEGLENAGAIKIPGEKGNDIGIGFIGKVKPKILKDYDIAQDVYIAQILLDTVIEKAVLKDSYRPFPKYPSAVRDISLICDKALPAEALFKAIYSKGGELASAAELIDVYEGGQIPPGKKSLAFSIRYGLETRTLTDAEIEKAHSGIKEELAARYNVVFR